MNENELSPDINQEKPTEQPNVVVKQEVNIEEDKQSDVNPQMNVEPSDNLKDVEQTAQTDAVSNETTNNEANTPTLEPEQEPEIEVIDYSVFTREELIDKLSELLQNDDLEKVKANVSAIKVAFHEKTRAEAKKSFNEKLEEENPVPEEETEENKEQVASESNENVNVKTEKPVDELEAKFNEVFNIYRDKRAKFLEQLEEQKQHNLVAKQQILDQLKELINSEETLKITYDEFRALQDKWKEIGAVPKTEVNNLWQNYHFLVEKFFDKVKINRELRDLDIKKNLEAKISLCEKVEELLLEKSVKKAFTKLQEYRQEWKEIGPVPSDKKEELWERFKTAADKINAQRKEHYQELKDQQDSNYAAKVAILEQSEKLVETLPDTLKGWQTVGDQLNELFKVWRSVGPAAKVQNDEIWGKFKPMLDNFFTAKKEFFGQLKGQLDNNYNLKLDLCTQAEAVKDSEDWGPTTQTLISLQKEWKNIGPTPKKYSDKIWKRFRSACDDFFTRKEKYFASINEVNDENLKKKQDIIERIKAVEINEDDVQGNLEILKKLQREWMDVGFVPKKDKDTIQNEYRTVVNEKLDKLKSIGADVSNYNFKNKIDIIKENNPNATPIINKERNQLFSKIQSMKEDVTLWENNIGFLANSKNSNLLKDEFEKKIERTKQEIALLEAKMKYIDEQK